MNIFLEIMTLDVFRRYMRGFCYDPAVFQDPGKMQPYVYDEETVDATWSRYRQLGRVHLAVMLEETPIGEVILKNFDQERRSCALGIHLQNDAVKNRGYGTQAEQLALKYAFENLGVETVCADALLENSRSRHVLEKVGFVPTVQDEIFQYYRCDRGEWPGFERA